MGFLDSLRGARKDPAPERATAPEQAAEPAPEQAPEPAAVPAAVEPEPAAEAPTPEPVAVPVAVEPDPEPVAEAPAPRSRVHVVAAGDTLDSIVAAHGADPAELARLNGLREGDTVVEGQVLVVRAG